MGILGRVSKWVGKSLARVKSFVLGQPAETYAGRSRESTGSPNSRASEQWIEAYSKNSRVSGPVRRIAEDVANVKQHLYVRTYTQDGRSEREEIHAHPILKLLRRPNPYMTYRQWIKLGVIYLELAGRFPCVIERWTQDAIFADQALWPDALAGRLWAGLPKWIWPVRPQDVVKMPTSKTPFWVVKMRGKRMRVAMGDMLWITYIDPADPYGYGMGSAPAVSDEVAQDNYASQWNTNFFRQGAHLSKIVNIPGMDDKTGERMKARFESDHQGVQNAHRTLFTNGAGGLTVADLSPNHKDLDFVEGKRHLRDTIAQNWGVPPELLGIIENSNRATVDAAVNIHQRMNIAHRCSDMTEQFNLQIVSQWGNPNLYLENENPVQETQEFILNQHTQGLKSGAVTVNEWRVANGKEPIEGGDVLLIPVNLAVSGVASLTAGTPMPVAELVQPQAEDELATEEEAQLAEETIQRFLGAADAPVGFETETEVLKR